MYTLFIALIVLIVVVLYYESRIGKITQSRDYWYNQTREWAAYSQELESKLAGDIATRAIYRGSDDTNGNVFQYGFADMIDRNSVAKPDSDGVLLLAQPTIDFDTVTTLSVNDAREAIATMPKVKSNSNKANGSKPSKSDNGSFAKSDNGNMYTSEKYGEFLDLLLKNQNVKKLSADKYAYAKDKFTQWETGKNPCDAAEYAKRVINAKFGGK